MAAKRRGDARRDRAVFLAWQTEIFARHKKLGVKDLKKALTERRATRIRPVTPEQQVLALHQMARLYGGSVRQATKG